VDYHRDGFEMARITTRNILMSDPLRRDGSSRNAAIGTNGIVAIVVAIVVVIVVVVVFIDMVHIW